MKQKGHKELFDVSSRWRKIVISTYVSICGLCIALVTTSWPILLYLCYFLVFLQYYPFLCPMKGVKWLRIIILCGIFGVLFVLLSSVECLYIILLDLYFIPFQIHLPDVQLPHKAIHLVKSSSMSLLLWIPVCMFLSYLQLLEGTLVGYLLYFHVSRYWMVRVLTRRLSFEEGGSSWTISALEEGGSCAEYAAHDFVLAAIHSPTRRKQIYKESAPPKLVKACEEHTKNHPARESSVNMMVGMTMILHHALEEDENGVVLTSKAIPQARKWLQSFASTYTSQMAHHCLYILDQIGHS